MNNMTRSLLGVALSAGAMYFFDPVSGHRRRLLLGDQCARTARRLELGTRDARHDLSHHMHDFASRARTQLGRRGISDKALTKATRGAIESSTSHPEAIACTVHEGNVYLRGDVLTYEHQHVLDSLRALEGVRVITDHLTTREPHESIRPLGHDGHDGWSIAGRFMVGAAGCALVYWGIKERKALGELGASAGHALWQFSKREIDDKIAGARDTTETGMEQAHEVAHDAGDLAAGFRSRGRETDIGTAASM